MSKTAPPAPDFNPALRNPTMLAAALALFDNRLHDAEPLLRARLKENPFDVAAIRMMAEVAGRIGRYKDAETLLRRAIVLAPGFLAARSNLATVLYRQHRVKDALAELDTLIEYEPDDVGNANLRAAAMGQVGNYEEAIKLYEHVLKRASKHPKIWMSYGHALKTVGRQADSITAYRKAIGFAPQLGEAWWSLANLKTVKFDDGDIAAMEGALGKNDLSNEDRFHLHFALGKAYEDRRIAETAFGHYEQGNALRRANIEYDAGVTTAHVDAAIALLTPEFLAARVGHGSPAADPIFILGMPRAGSTLIEQILSSHSMVEGTMELPDIPAIAGRLGGIDQWPQRLSTATPDALRRMGESFLETTRIQRKSDKPYFIDKLPNNWINIALILAILPNAKIIDARRHPMGCCFSNFKQHFARGQNFSYSLSDIGHYYADYVLLMRHVDVVAPGRVVRVIYEDMVADSEAETRRLLDALGLPFEEACLSFYKNDRAVRTPSSEQVRQPIFTSGTEQWQMFAPWLGPLEEALGDVLTGYREVIPTRLP
jgi:tetratricopeptide (TPR) repeat protein